MKIEVLLNLGTDEFGPDALQAGIHDDVPDGLAEVLINRRLAIPVDEPVVAKMVAKQESAIGESRPIAVHAKPPEIKTDKPVEAPKAPADKPKTETKSAPLAGRVKRTEN